MKNPNLKKLGHCFALFNLFNGRLNRRQLHFYMCFCIQSVAIRHVVMEYFTMSTLVKKNEHLSITMKTVFILQYGYKNYFDLTDPLKASVGSLGVLRPCWKTTSSDLKELFLGLSWWSSGLDSILPLQRAWVPSLSGN